MDDTTRSTDFEGKVQILRERFSSSPQEAGPEDIATAQYPIPVSSAMIIISEEVESAM